MSDLHLKEHGALLFELGFDLNYIRNFMKRKKLLFMHNCEVCGKPDNEKPMAFRMKPWCCEDHRKKIQGDVKIERH